MKTKLFLAAMAVTFSFAVFSCSGNKTANAASEGDEATTTIETVESVAVEATDSCCQVKDSTACCQKDSTACCEKKADCAEKKECCDKK